MLRRALLGLSRRTSVKNTLTRLPVTRSVVDRYVAGEQVDDAIAVTGRLVAAGLRVTIDHLGEDTVEPEQADAVTLAYLDLLDRLGSAGLATAAEVSVKLSAVGGGLDDGERVARDNARMICAAAASAGTTVTVDMEDHTTTDTTLATVAELRTEFPSVGAVLQSYLRRTESDCRELAGAGSRVRLCKGAYDEPESVAFVDRDEVDRSYVRCLKVLMAGDGLPMVASHDPRLVAIAEELARTHGRGTSDYELQMLYGIRPTEQQRLANAGRTLRVYLPYGTDWYGYLVRRLAERPANLTFFARSLLSRR